MLYSNNFQAACQTSLCILTKIPAIFNHIPIKILGSFFICSYQIFLDNCHSTYHKNTKKPEAFASGFYTGDEGIEPPPKVLETPIIPLDQSPIT